MRIALMLLLALLFVGCTDSRGSPRHDPVLAAAGDIACDPTSTQFHSGEGAPSSCHEQITAQLLSAGHYDAIMPVGDEQYECGDDAAFHASYGATWGKLLPITYPVIGNHEYGGSCHRSDPSGYFDYFGAKAGPPGGYYSFDLGSWHIIVLNSECHSGKGQYKVRGCEIGSPQEQWLRADLAAHPSRCTLAAWHEPRFSSGEHGDAQQMADIWNDLMTAHVDVVLSGHNHDYERFEPIGATPGEAVVPGATTETGKVPANYQQPNLDLSGIREFVVGTGGKNHYGFPAPPLRGEQVRNSDTFGLLALTLHPQGYDWRFVPEPGHSFSDSGSGSCH